MTDNSAGTAAELDELHADLIACRDYLVKQLGSAGEDLTIYDRAAAALASLRKQLDEARRVQMTKADLRTVIELTRANAQMAAALREIDSFYRQGIDDRTFAGCVGDVLKRYAASQEAPASPAAEDGESEADYNRRCDDLILSIKAATPAPASPSPETPDVG